MPPTRRTQPANFDSVGKFALEQPITSNRGFLDIRIIVENLNSYFKIDTMISRTLLPQIKRGLKNNPAVALLGSRQTGKTTLALEIGESVPCVYLDLEAADDLAKLENPRDYLSRHSDKLVILDEVQRKPDLFLELRGLIDEWRRKGEGNGKYLILGSASRALLKQTSESLAGRIAYMELGGLSPIEVGANDPRQLQTLWDRGGYPESYLAQSDSASYEWRNSFMRTYLERDIPQLGIRTPAETLLRLWTMLAHSQGELLNASKLAQSIGLTSVTVSNHLSAMTDLLIIRKLQPWHANVKKRLVKSPRMYVRDSGLLHSLLRIADYERLLSHPVLGKSWEGFVIENLIQVLPPDADAFFYRTVRGAEIDLLVEFANSELWAVEIKHSHAPSTSRGFYHACEDLRPAKKYIVYGGAETFPLKNDVTAVSLPSLMAEISKQFPASKEKQSG